MEQWIEEFAEVLFRRSSDTAHDLKTPLNIAVLNLELLRMRIRKLGTPEDEKLGRYFTAVEGELRRLATIFDAFFIYTVPPADAGPPQGVDILEILRRHCQRLGLKHALEGQFRAVGHGARIEQLSKLFIEGVVRNFEVEVIDSATSSDGLRLVVSARGRPRSDDSEIGKVFKFYYTDASGAPDLSLATGRLIAETYGGTMSVHNDDAGRVALKLELPQGEK